MHDYRNRFCVMPFYSFSLYVILNIHNVLISSADGGGGGGGGIPSTLFTGEGTLQRAGQGFYYCRLVYLRLEYDSAHL